MNVKTFHTCFSLAQLLEWCGALLPVALVQVTYQIPWTSIGAGVKNGFLQTYIYTLLYLQAYAGPLGKREIEFVLKIS